MKFKAELRQIEKLWQCTNSSPLSVIQSSEILNYLYTNVTNIAFYQHLTSTKLIYTFISSNSANIKHLLKSFFMVKPTTTRAFILLHTAAPSVVFCMDMESSPYFKLHCGRILLSKKTSTQSNHAIKVSYILKKLNRYKILITNSRLNQGYSFKLICATVDSLSVGDLII